VFPESNFGEGLTGAEKAAHTADCDAFMGGILRNGEFAAMRYFLQLSRTLGKRLRGMLSEPASVGSPFTL
jgi:hypothetical protein